MTDPVALVRAFIADHYRWNGEAQDRQSRAGRSDAAQQAAMEWARSHYAKLLGKYCRPGFAGQPIAFGTPPLHDPEREEVVSGRPLGDRCLVRTRLTDEDGDTDKFEYRLVREGGRWFLVSVKYVDEDGRWESL